MTSDKTKEIPITAPAQKPRANAPRAMAELVPVISRDIYGRKNLMFGKMLAEWSHIAGPDIASRCTPMDLRFLKQAAGQKQGTGSKPKEDAKGTRQAPPKGPRQAPGQAVLHLAVAPAFALEFSYQKNLLIERLNMFFGYAAIKDIKIVQNSSIMDKKPILRRLSPAISLTEQKKIEAMVAGIQENDLQTALKNLGKAIISRNKATSRGTQ